MALKRSWVMRPLIDDRRIPVFQLLTDVSVWCTLLPEHEVTNKITFPDVHGLPFADRQSAELVS